MTPQVLREMLNRRPFLPFRLFVSDGQHFDITRPELVFPGASIVIIGMVRDVQSEFFDEPVIVANRHITGTDPIIPTEAATAG